MGVKCTYSIIFHRQECPLQFLYQVQHCKENPIYVFLFWELRGLSPNFHIHVFVNNLYIPRNRIGQHISKLQNRQIDPGNI
jgi:hypothetical protein